MLWFYRKGFVSGKMIFREFIPCKKAVKTIVGNIDKNAMKVNTITVTPKDIGESIKFEDEGQVLKKYKAFLFKSGKEVKKLIKEEEKEKIEYQKKRREMKE